MLLGNTVCTPLDGAQLWLFIYLSIIFLFIIMFCAVINFINSQVFITQICYSYNLVSKQSELNFTITHQEIMELRLLTEFYKTVKNYVYVRVNQLSRCYYRSELQILSQFYANS